MGGKFFGGLDFRQRQTEMLSLPKQLQSTPAPCSFIDLSRREENDVVIYFFSLSFLIQVYLQNIDVPKKEDLLPVVKRSKCDLG